jgi:TolA-binding protein
MKYAWVNTAAIAAVFALAPGCFWVTTKHEGQRLRGDVDRIESQVQEQEETLGTRVARLQQVLDEATELLARNSADLGADVNEMVEEQARLTGLVMEASRAVAEIRNELSVMRSQQDDLQQRLVLLEQRVADDEENDPEKLFARGREAFTARNYEEANRIFRYLVVQFPEFEKADEAQYHRGESHYRMNNFESALGEFQRVFDRHPNSRIAPDALFRAGETAFKLKWCTDARAYFMLLRQRYGDSQLAARAQRMEEQVRAAQSDTSKCQS